MTITLPSITIPSGCEGKMRSLLAGVAQVFQFNADPGVIADAGMRACTTQMEHVLTEAMKQLDEAEARAAAETTTLVAAGAVAAMPNG